MSTEKQKASAIAYVSFAHPLSIGGDFASIEYWSVEKHGNQITCEERGNWVHLTYKGMRFRVPMVNVAFIREVME